MRSNLMISIAVVLLAIGGIIIWSSRPSEPSQDMAAGKIEAGKSASDNASPSTAPKTERPEITPHDGSGYTIGSPEWLNSQAGKDFLEMRPEDGVLEKAAKLVEEIDPETHQQILESLVFLQFAPDVPMETYQPKQPVPADWKTASKILGKTVAYSLGPGGTDPKFIYSGNEYFLFSNSHHEDFSRGEALRKADGAVFSWDLKKAVTVDR